MRGHQSIHTSTPRRCRFDFPQCQLTTAPGLQDQTTTCSLDHADHTSSLSTIRVGQLNFEAEESCYCSSGFDSRVEALLQSREEARTFILRYWTRPGVLLGQQLVAARRFSLLLIAEGKLRRVFRCLCACPLDEPFGTFAYRRQHPRFPRMAHARANWMGGD